MTELAWTEAFYEADEGDFPEVLARTAPSARVPTTADELGLPKDRDVDGPLVSVIILNFGDDKFLPDALQSVAAQTYSNIEIIIVDKSKVEWLARLAEDCDWIRYFRQDAGGISAARNLGIKSAKGEYVAFLDADDYWHPRKLTDQLEALGERTEPLVFSAWFEIRNHDTDDWSVRVMDDTFKNRDFAWRDRILGKFYAIPSTILFHKSVVSERPFPESIQSSEDFVFLIEQFLDQPPIHVSNPLAVSRRRPNSITGMGPEFFENKLQAIEYLFQRYPRTRKYLVKEYRSIVDDITDVYLSRGENRKARDVTARAMFLEGVYYLTTSDVDTANTRFDRAIEMAPTGDRADYHLKIGREYLDQDDKESAKMHFIKGTSADGTYGSRLTALGSFFGVQVKSLFNR